MHDPHDLSARAAKIDRLTDDIAVTTVATLPELVAEDRDEGKAWRRLYRGRRTRRPLRWSRRWQCVVLGEVAPKLDAGTKQPENVRRRIGDADLFRLAAFARHRAAPGHHCGKVLEKSRLTLQIPEIGGREWKVVDVAVAQLPPHEHQPVGMGVRQGPQQHSVHDTEDRRADADA